MIEKYEVFEAIRRSHPYLSNHHEEEIVAYFNALSPEQLSGHINNIKGVLFEQEYQDVLREQGIESRLFEHTNHPITDIQIINDGEVVDELQLKATDSESYIQQTLEADPAITVVTTSEVATSMATSEVVNSGISNAVLEEAVVDTIFPVSKVGVGISIVSFLLFGFSL